MTADPPADAAEAGPLFINPIVHAEESIRFTTVEALEEALPPRDYRREPLPWTVAFPAGKVFLDYRGNKGTSPTTLADFFIGAHAAVAGLDLLTRDVGRYRTYFPTVSLLAPESRLSPAARVGLASGNDDRFLHDMQRDGKLPAAKQTPAAIAAHAGNRATSAAVRHARYNSPSCAARSTLLLDRPTCTTDGGPGSGTSALGAPMCTPDDADGAEAGLPTHASPAQGTDADAGRPAPSGRAPDPQAG